MALHPRQKLKPSKKKPSNPFGWFKLERYENLSLTPLQWYRQIALRQALVMYVAPGLLDSKGAEHRSALTAPPLVVEESVLDQATSAWKKIKSKPVCAHLQLLHGDLADLLSGASPKGDLSRGVRNITYADMAVAGFFCRELKLRGVNRREFDAYSADPRVEGNYHPWMSEAIYTGLANKQLFGMLSVDLELPDKCIRVEFERWLADTRRRWRDAWTISGTNDPTWMDDLAMLGKPMYNIDSFGETGLLPCLDLLISAGENGVRLTSMDLANFLRYEGPARDQSVRSGVRQRAFDLLTRAEDGVRMMRWLEEQIALELAQHRAKTANLAKKKNLGIKVRGAPGV